MLRSSNLENCFRQLTDKPIYFGHQSVGNNILQGLQDLASERGVPLFAPREYRGETSLQSPGLYHAKIGRNTSPLSKIDDFVAQVEKGAGDRAHIACFKFCYIDIVANTDLNAVFDRYRLAMKRLRENFRKTSFAHITVPLTVIDTNIPARLRRILGRPDRSIADNLARNRFNDMMRNEYKSEPIFDLAELESSASGARRSIYNSGQGKIFYLTPEYSDDGRHLNPAGRRWIAAAFAGFLAGVLESRSSFTESGKTP